jgi:hypothetical protein
MGTGLALLLGRGGDALEQGFVGRGRKHAQTVGQKGAHGWGLIFGGQLTQVLSDANR